MSCLGCRQERHVREITTCWCQQDFCASCLAAHLPTCAQRGQWAAPTRVPRPDPVRATIAAGFQRLSETLRQRRLGSADTPGQRWWDR